MVIALALADYENHKISQVQMLKNEPSVY